MAGASRFGTSAFAIGAAILGITLGAVVAAAQSSFPADRPLVDATPVPAQPANSPERVLASVIQQLQTGQLYRPWYGESFMQSLAQHGNYAAQLAELGAPVRIDLIKVEPVQGAGAVYSMNVTHTNGLSAWYLGYSTATHRIEYGDYAYQLAFPKIPQSDQPQQQQQHPSVPEAPVRREISQTPQAPATPTACAKFPNLC